MAVLTVVVRFTAENDSKRGLSSKTILAELEVLVGTTDEIKAAYKEVIAERDRDWFELNWRLSDLRMLQDLGFRPENVGAAIATLDRALARLNRPDDRWQPRQVLLFSGHIRRRSPRERSVRRSTSWEPMPKISRSARPRREATSCSSKHARPRRSLPRPAAVRRAGVRRTLDPAFHRWREVARSLLRHEGQAEGADQRHLRCAR